ncbi:MAG: soj 3, partial [Phycisphaerales bacterium]|nr:soj 3 [Phycisphaerales bacterium]
MRVIALMNQKGGVGKTTTTVNLGAALAEYGKRVCLMDLDPQAHLTINYGVDPTPEINSLYDVLIEETPLLDALLGIDKGISLVPSSIDLAAAEVELVSVLGREMLLKKRLEAAVADPSKEFDYDFVLLDCPPSLGLLTLNGLAMASEVLIPMQPHFLALQGVAKLLETVHLVSKRMNPGLKVAGIVLTLYDAQAKLSAEVLAELNGFIEASKGKNLPWSGARVYESRIRRNIKLAESPGHGEHIIKYDPGSNGAADYRALAREVLGITEEQGRALAAAANPPPAPQPVTATPVKPKRGRPRKVKPTDAPAAAPVVPPAGGFD